jgi:hypothetical protein
MDPVVAVGEEAEVEAVAVADNKRRKQRPVKRERRRPNHHRPRRSWVAEAEAGDLAASDEDRASLRAITM